MEQIYVGTAVQFHVAEDRGGKKRATDVRLINDVGLGFGAAFGGGERTLRAEASRGRRSSRAPSMALARVLCLLLECRCELPRESRRGWPQASRAAPLAL